MGKLKRMREDLDQLYQNVVLPELKYQEYRPDVLSDTQLAQISEDPRLRQAQIQALEGVQDVVSQGGLTAMDRARLDEIQSQAGAREKAQRDALMQSYAQRGLGGSGAEMAAALANQQAAAQTASRGGLQVAAEAQARKERALGQLGGLGSQVRGQDYGIARERAGAQDEINKFNTMLRNQAFLRNAEERNRIAQQQYMNEAQLRDARAGHIREAMAERKARLEDIKNKVGGILDVGGSLLGSYSSGGSGDDGGGGGAGTLATVASLFSDERLKENVSKVGEKNGIGIYDFDFIGKPGRYRGVMAQEVAKVRPDAVTSEKGLLKVRYDKLGIEPKRIA